MSVLLDEVARVRREIITKIKMEGSGTVSKQYGIPLTYISQIKHGKEPRTIDRLLKIADKLNIKY